MKGLSCHQHLADTILCQLGRLFLKTRDILSICEGQYTCLHCFKTVPRHTFSYLLDSEFFLMPTGDSRFSLFQEILPNILPEFCVVLLQTIKHTRIANWMDRCHLCSKFIIHSLETFKKTGIKLTLLILFSHILVF